MHGSKQRGPILKLPAAFFNIRAFVHQVIGIAAEPIDSVSGMCEAGMKESGGKVETFGSFGRSFGGALIQQR